MKAFPVLPLMIALMSLFNACKKGEDVQPPVQLIINGDIEQTPSLTRSRGDWLFGYYYNLTSNPNGYKAAHTTEAAASGTHSLKIVCDGVKNDTTFCFFEQDIVPTTIAVGSKLTLKAKIKTRDLKGQGVALAMIGYKQIGNKNTIVFFPTTEKTPITGTNEFKEYTVTVDSYPGNIDIIAVHLFYLPKTTGIVYVDDFSLAAN